MPKLTGTFAADGAESLELRLVPNQAYVVSLTASPSLTGSVQLVARDDSLAASRVLQTYTATTALTEYRNTTGKDLYIRLRCVDLDAGTETVAYVLQSLIGGTRIICESRAKVGATSGWVINTASNIGVLATLPASRTTNTMVIAVDGLKIGDVITGFYPIGQVESAGNNATLTVELRKLTAAAADIVDASVATTGAVTFAADSVLGRVTMPAEDVNALVSEGESYYFLVTGTTAASTDIALQGIVVAHRNGD
jgi:hypothetical protein